MSAATSTAVSIPRAASGFSPYWLASDTWEIFKRSATQILRTPGQLFSLVILQPVLLIVLFRYVFGGAVVTGGMSYANFLIPGVFVMNAVLVANLCAVSVASDMTTGTIDRFRSLPMAKSAVFGGTILANTLRNLVALVAMIAVGLLVGFRPDASAVDWLAAIGLLMLVTYAFSWLLAVFGLLASNPEGAQQMGGLVWPFTFISSGFVPAESMPDGLRQFAENQPLTQAIDAVRALLVGEAVGNAAWLTVVWCVGLTLVGMVLTGILFKRKFD